MLKNRLSKQFLIWVIVLAVVILSCSIIILFFQNYSFSNYTESQENIDEKYAYVEIIDETINESVIDFSRFVISEDSSYLNVQDQHQQRVEDVISELNQLSSTKADETFVANSEAFYRYYFNDLQVLAASYEKGNQTEEMAALFNDPQFNEEVDSIRQDSLAYKANLNDELSQTSQTFESNRQLIIFAVLIYIFLSLVTVFVILRIILRRIASPLEELTEAVNQVSSGERNVSIKELSRDDELGVLSKAFKRMVSKINQSEIVEQQLHKELSEKNKDLEQIVYIASHDLRSPLINIQGFNKELQASFDEIQSLLESEHDVAAINEKLTSVMEEDIPEAFHFIVASTDKMDSLLNALLRLSRIGREKVNIQPLNMNDVVSKVAKNYEFLLGERNIRLEICELPYALGDSALIDQVFSNLIGNALKFLQPDRAGHIKVYGYEDNERSIYCVEDNGIGISEQFQQQIFNLFEKIDPYKGGEGIGLTIVGKIMERNNGEFWVESNLDKYSKFYFSLPKATEVNIKEDEQ